MRKLHGGCGTLTYSRWKSMMQRCNTPTCGNYKYYGALGVKVCERWHDFANFRDDMGECPDRTMTLDRIENSKGYEPGNCRWITQAEQNKNRTHCVMLEHNGVTKNVADWAVEIGMTANALSMRLRLGWSVEKALSTPVKPSPKPRKAANSYFGLLSQASHSQKDRAALANLILRRGNTVNSDLTKTYKKK